MVFSPGLTPSQQLKLAAAYVVFISENALRMKERWSPDHSTPNEMHYDWLVELTSTVIAENRSSFDPWAKAASYAHHLVRAIQRDEAFGEALREAAPQIVNDAFEIALAHPEAAPDDHAGRWGTPGPPITDSPRDQEWASSKSLDLSIAYSVAALDSAVSLPTTTEVNPEALRQRYNFLRSLGSSPEKAMSTIDDLTSDRFDDGPQLTDLDSIEAPRLGYEGPGF